MLGLGVNIAKYQPSGNKGLLDLYGSGVSAAYSLRNLYSSYANQPVVRLRRQFDNVERDFTATDLANEEAIKQFVLCDYQDYSPLNIPTMNLRFAYSTRHIDSSIYMGPVVRIRRSSDNLEQDFIAEELTDGTLLAFCGGSTGYVTTWYDQGSTYNATQTVSIAQPTLVNSGVLSVDSKNGFPSIDFSAVGVHFDLGTTAFAIEPPLLMFTVHDYGTTDNQRLLDNRGAGALLIGTQLKTNSATSAVYYSENAIDLVQLAGDNSLSPGDNNILWVRDEGSGNAKILAVNGALLDSNTDTYSASPLSTNNATIGIPTNETGTQEFDGKLQELIVYNSYDVADRIRVESDIYLYYDYSLELEQLTTSADAYLVTWYDQSGNNLHLNQSISSQQPYVVNDTKIITLSNGLSAVRSDSTRCVYRSPSVFTGDTDRTVFAVYEPVNIGSAGSGRIIVLNDFVGGDGTVWVITEEDSGDNWVRVNGGNASFTVPHATPEETILVVKHLSGSLTDDTLFYNNGIVQTLSSTIPQVVNTAPVPPSEFGIFSTPQFAGEGGLDGYISEVIFYGENKTDYIDISQTINTYYSIY